MKPHGYIRAAALIAILFVFIPFSVSYAADSKVGIFEDYDGMYCENFDGYSAYAKDYIKQIAGYMGETYSEDNITAGKASEINGDIDSGALDYSVMVSRSSANGAIYDYADVPICTVHISLYALPESDCYFEDYKHMDGMTVGVSTGGSGMSRTAAEQYAADNGFKINIKEYDTDAALRGALDKGEIDAAAIEHIGEVDTYRLIGKCSTTDLYCAVRKGNTNKLAALNKALLKLSIDAPFYDSKLYAQYFGYPAEFLSGTTREENNAVKEHNVIRLVSPTENFPLDYFDDSDKFGGVYKEMLDWISEKTGLSFEVTRCASVGDMYAKAENGEIDGIVETYGSDNGTFSLTSPYITTEYHAIVKTEQNLDGDTVLKVAINTHAYSAKQYLEKNFPKWRIVECGNAEDTIDAVESGKADCALMSSSVMETSVTLAAYADLTTVSDFRMRVPVSIGLNMSALPPEIMQLINKRIGVMPKTVSENAVENVTLTNTYVPNAKDMLKRYSTAISIALLLAVAAAFVLIMRRSKRYKEMTIRDSLTGLYNRNGFELACDRKLEKSEDAKYYIAVMDLDNFRSINETLGRDKGDELLKSIANRLTVEFPGDLCARNMGDTFILMVDKTPDMLAKLNKLPSLSFYGENLISVLTSLKVGICATDLIKSKKQLAAKIIHRADLARQNVKGKRYNDVGIYSADMEQELDNRSFIEREMEHALEDGQFMVYYQPKYDTVFQQIIGAEALVRWKHPERGMIGPNLFIPVFEKNGFITKLDFFVYEETMKFIKYRLENNLKIVPISVNISRYHLLDVHFVEALDALVLKYDIPKDMLELEITESTFGDNDTIATNFMRQLKSRGFSISMDDFGSGYSSLNLLRELPIDVLKIDQGFLSPGLENERSLLIITNVIHMACDMNIRTICEGVETTEQFNFLKQAGCDMVQGYLFAKPMPREDFEELLAG